MNTSPGPKCDTCLWDGSADGSELGECKNATSRFYRGPEENANGVRIAPDMDVCGHYKSVPALLGQHPSPSVTPAFDLVTPVRRGLAETIYVLSLTGMFFFGVFRSGPVADIGYTRTEREPLSL